MSDTYVTFHGWVGNEVTHRDPNGVSVVNFRVASTPRIKRKGEWMDGDTTWYSVSAWRGLAATIRVSVQKGAAVIVRPAQRGVDREDGGLAA
jgi:single-strand DNA-binding protein